jgi:hypothetical protein
VGGVQPAAADLVQATYLGGRERSAARAVAVDPTTGDFVIAGTTSMADIPNTMGGAQPASTGGTDVWVARLSGDLRIVEQATYLGGSSAEYAGAIAIDPKSGDVLVAGATSSPDFPATTGGAQPALSGSSDVFVARLSGDLTTLRQATYLGGSGSEEADLAESPFGGGEPLGIVIDPISGEVVVGGTTESTDFPGTLNGALPPGGGPTNGFVARLSGTLQTLVRATYTGIYGTAVYDVAINALTGEIVAGGSYVATQPPLRHYGVVSCFSSDLRQIKGLARLAMSGKSTDVLGLATDATMGDVYAAGETSGSLDHPQGGGQPTFGGGTSDAFVARLDHDLGLLQSTYFGGSGNEGGIIRPMIDSASGDVFVTGTTDSPDLPARQGGAQSKLSGRSDAFVARFNGGRSGLTHLEQATYLGGSLDDGAVQLASSANAPEVIAVGYTASVDFPVTAGGAQPMFATPAASDSATAAFAARLDAALTGSTATPTPVLPSPTATVADPTATPTQAPPGTPRCAGDCDGTGQVTIADLVTGIDIALGNAPLAACPVFDANGDSRVTIDDLFRAIENALDGCR